jgi:hypothetical protein
LINGALNSGVITAGASRAWSGYGFGASGGLLVIECRFYPEELADGRPGEASITASARSGLFTPRFRASSYLAE